MKLKRLLFSLTIIAMLATTFASCSHDEKEVVPKNDISEQIPDYESTFSLEKDSILVEFRLLNQDLSESTTFSYGEDIIFDLNVTNKCTAPIPYQPNRLLGENMFRVYRASGWDMGISWNDGDFLDRGFYLFPNQPEHFRCPWYGKNTKPSYPFMQKSYVPVLPAGQYYVIAPITVRGVLKLECKIYFKIEQR